MNLVDEGYQIVKKDLLRNIPVVITVTNMARFKSHFRLKCLKFSLDVDFFKDTGTMPTYLLTYRLVCHINSLQISSK